MPTSVFNPPQIDLEGLRGKFLDRITERCLAIECIVVGAEGTHPTEVERAQIAHYAHKTVGVAATFGYGTLGERARDVERIMSPNDVPDWSTARPVINAMLQEMERILDDAG